MQDAQENKAQLILQLRSKYRRSASRFGRLTPTTNGQESGHILLRISTFWPFLDSKPHPVTSKLGFPAHVHKRVTETTNKNQNNHKIVECMFIFMFKSRESE